MRLLTIGSIEPIAGFEDRLKLEFDLLKEDGFEITYKKIAKDNISFYHCYVDDELLLMENNFINIKQRFINCIANALSDVIQNLDNGYSEISTWDYASMKDIVGFVPTELLKTVELNEKYGVVVNLSKQKVYIYEDNVLVKTFACSSGLDENYYYTPKGLYRIGERGDSFFSPKYGQGAYHWVRFNNNYLFHSVPFDANRNIIEEEAAKLGQKASHGCIRLSLDDALWFYNNIPKGTPVLIKD